MPSLHLARPPIDPAPIAPRRTAPARPRTSDPSEFSRELAAANPAQEQRADAPVPREPPVKTGCKANDKTSDKATSEPSKPEETTVPTSGKDNTSADPLAAIPPAAPEPVAPPLPLALMSLAAPHQQPTSPAEPQDSEQKEDALSQPKAALCFPGMGHADGPESQPRNIVQGMRQPGETETPAGHDQHAAALPAAQTTESRAIMPPPPGLAPLAPLQTAASAQIAAPTPVTAPVPIQHVPVTIATMASEGTRRFDIRLDPPDLGRIDVTLAVDAEGGIRTHLSVERPETLQLLRNDAHRLDQAFADAGLTSDPAGPEFSLRNSGGGEERQRPAHRDPLPGSTDTSPEPPDARQLRPAPRPLKTAAARLDLSL